MHVSDAVQTLDRELRELLGSRLRSLVEYGASNATGRAPTSTLAVVDRLTADDLRACSGRVAAWHDAGLATPLMVATHEFGRSLDAFPFEFGAILSDHVVVSGVNPFEGLRVDPADLRRACEIQTRSHLLHLRQGYIETEGRGDAIADLVARSAAPLAALLKSVSRLQGISAADAQAAASHIERTISVSPGSLNDIVKLSGAQPLPSDLARRIFARYLDAMERLTDYIDRWNP
jgi:hypothetical protein